MRSLLLRSAILLPLSLHAQNQKASETFWQMVLRYAGISSNPGGLRADPRIIVGDVWLAEVASNPSLQRLTADGGYRSPVFESASTVLAIRGSALVRIPVARGESQQVLRALAGVRKLVAMSLDNPDHVLVLTSGPNAAVLSVKRGSLSPLPHDPASAQDLALIAELDGSDRTYGTTRLYLETQARVSPAGGEIEFTDILLKRIGEPPVNLTRGNGVSSAQPSLCSAGTHVVFIRPAR